MAPQAQTVGTPLPVGTTLAAGSLRAEMEARRSAGEGFSVREIIGIAVPLCTRLASLHAQGQRFFVHPSSLRYTRGREIEVAEDRARSAPTLARDRACLAPEERKEGTEGDSRASVFAVGAIIYELLTSKSVGPGMRRPADVVPDLDARLEAILGKALVADPKHRPADLAALAQALHHVAPGASLMPPPADESHLDHDEDFEVDVRLSMIPPSEAPPPMAIPKAAPMPRIAEADATRDGPYAVSTRKGGPDAQRVSDPTQRLSELKESLEADPRPRYVVVKHSMDHGPFSAVELLQQIGSGTFGEKHALRDVFSGEERPIKEWEEFSPFAEQAKLNREIVQEKRAVAADAVKEKQGTQYKVLVGAALLGVVLAAAAGLWARPNRAAQERVGVQTDSAVSIDIDGGIGSGQTKKASVGGGAGWTGGAARPAGNLPVLAGGMSCDRARNTYVEELKMGGDQGPADLTAGQYGAVLNKGTYLNSCGVPSTMGVTICAAVQNGRAVGVTVTTTPPSPGISSCISGAVRSLPFPSNPRLDVTTTSFAPN